MKKSFLLALGFMASASVISTSAFAQATASAAMGKGLYTQAGANSCQHCHGMTGEGGNVKEAAKLVHPKTWKVFKALGGEAAYKKNPKEFVAHMKEATTSLIVTGAIRHNSTFKQPWYNGSAAGSYNAQMMGLGGAPSVGWMNKYKERGVTAAIAAESAWLFLETLDKDGVFTK